MANDKKMLTQAAAVALGNANRSVDNRTFTLGAVGLRNDGVIVSSRNVSALDYAPDHHAEARLVRKMTPNSIIWVARVLKNGTWAIAKPCNPCRTRLKAAGVRRVVYTIGHNEWGIMDLDASGGDEDGTFGFSRGKTRTMAKGVHLVSR